MRSYLSSLVHCRASAMLQMLRGLPRRMVRRGLRGHLAAIPDALALLRLDGRLVLIDVNPAAASLLRVSRSAASGTYWAAVCSEPQASDTEHRARACLASGESAEFETTLGGCRLSVRLVPLPRAHVLLAITDITQRVQQERANAQACALDAIGRVTAGMAHDFNNLLQAQLASLELLLDEIAPYDDRRELAEAALRMGQRSALLTQQLLSFSRKQLLQPRGVPVRSFLGSLSSTLATTMGPQVQISVVVGIDQPVVRADPAKLANAVLALAHNARDAMPAGGRLAIDVISASAGHKQAPPGLPPGDFVAIVLADTGEGMPADVIARACEPFFTTKGAGGSGLGLSMALGFARQSGGDLHIDSTPATGTRVALWLPAESGAVAAVGRTTPPGAPRTASPPVRAGGAGRVLLVDDAADVLITVGVFMEGAGFDVVQVSSGDRALALLSAGERFDALVTDYAMPGLNGADLILSAVCLQPQLPVVIITAHADVDGFDILPQQVQVLHKPFRRDDLTRMMAQVMRAPGAVAAARHHERR